ncbi:hypothetical protein [Treponema sp. Marseille-Q4132]|uniref:hypothetical protein n=1 Tax=Treponema sp. Marseille-Q4132 TaxID=2766701 RepID=UPI0016531D88|nr:hypothetical protein [Treponema sp. Marseille-Q4132]QNL98177.1 hypothetical protein H9I35_05400 [Treponema sp. Marseille-Q4132]
MTSGQKIAVSVLTTAVIFACFVVAAFAGLFSKIEARFYEPAKIADIRKQLDSVAECSETYINTLLEQFGTGEKAYLSDSSVASYALSSPADSDVQQRTRRTASLFSEASGLDGIRLIDVNGRSVHFSTYPSDILKQTDSMRIYKNYDELRTHFGSAEVAFFKVSVPDAADGRKYRIVFDGENNRILFAFPFYDPYDIYCGTIVFYVSAQDFNRTLIARNLTTVGNTGDLVSDSSGAIGGFVFGMPSLGRDDIEREAVARWRVDSKGPDKIASISANGGESKESYWILISSNRSRFIKTAGVYRDSIFIMPHTVQFLLLTCVFITLFLTIFMLFNLRRDDMVVIRDRVKRFQLALINEYFENKETINWADVSQKIASRKNDVSEAIKESLGKRAKRHSEETKALIDKSWEEILGALSVKTNASETSALPDSKEIRRMLEEILRSGAVQTPYNAAPEKSSDEEATEISLGRESIEADGFFETNTEIVNAATETEEAFFENENGSESSEKNGSGENAADENRSDESAHKTSESETADTADFETRGEEISEDEKIDAFGEIRMGEESAISDDLFDGNTESVNAPAEIEEIFFDNLIAAESVPPSKTDAAKKDAAVETEIAESVESAPSAPPSKTDAVMPVMEDVDIDLFMDGAGDIPAPDDDIFAEPLQLGEPKNECILQEEAKPIDFDVVSAPNFLFLDEERKEDESRKSPEKEDAAYTGIPFAADVSAESPRAANGDAVDAEDIQPIEKAKGAVPFSFTSFASHEEKIQNLAPASDGVIIEGGDGVFSIASGIAFDGVVQDEAFKRLVDSVIK